MSEVLTSTVDGQGRIGPGRLVLITGPSGAGKDTLIALAQAQCGDDVLFVRRVVTRAASLAENNEEISADAFEVAAARGAFALHWQAHGHHYGLPRTIDDAIRAGRAAVANVSRTVISAARRAYADVVVVSITAPPDVLAARLAQRGRDSDGPLTQRLSRVVDHVAAPPDVVIENVGDARAHARELLNVIRLGTQP